MDGQILTEMRGHKVCCHAWMKKFCVALSSSCTGLRLSICCGCHDINGVKKMSQISKGICWEVTLFNLMLLFLTFYKLLLSGFWKKFQNNLLQFPILVSLLFGNPILGLARSWISLGSVFQSCWFYQNLEPNLVAMTMLACTCLLPTYICIFEYCVR